MLDKSNTIITLCGYSRNTNTCWYPWKKFYEIFKDHLGYETEWLELNQIKPTKKRRVFVCWIQPDADLIIESGAYKSGDIILQKVTAVGRTDRALNWGTNPAEFFKDWGWTSYRMIEKHFDNGIDIHGFGCRTDPNLFEEKKRICDKLSDRWHWIPWGSGLYSWDEIQNAKPIMDNFEYDIGYVGSLWGKVGRGNVDAWQEFIQPLLDSTESVKLAGRIGIKGGPANDEEHKRILAKSRLCPIMNAPSWRAEAAIQDRFWSVFTAGRFGVVDSKGAYLFFDEKDVVCEEDPGEYIEKSLYYMKNVDKQLPYITKALERIKNEYNYYHTWEKILGSLS